MEDIIDFQPFYFIEKDIKNEKEPEKIKKIKTIKHNNNCTQFKKLYYSCMKEKNNDFKKCFEQYDDLIFCIFD